jgi:hypothetical protein
MSVPDEPFNCPRCAALISRPKRPCSVDGCRRNFCTHRFGTESEAEGPTLAGRCLSDSGYRHETLGKPRGAASFLHFGVTHG